MFGFDNEQIQKFGTNLLMVFGGFAAGYVVTMLAGFGIESVLKMKFNPVQHKWLRRLGGIIVALIVAFFVFRNGTGPGGGGNNTGPNAGEQPSTGTQPTTPDSKKPDPKETVDAVVVRLKVFAGEKVEAGSGKYFELEGQGEQIGIAAVEAAVKAKLKDSPGKVIVVFTLHETATKRTYGFQDVLEPALARLKVPLIAEDDYARLKAK